MHILMRSFDYAPLFGDPSATGRDERSVTNRRRALGAERDVECHSQADGVFGDDQA